MSHRARISVTAMGAILALATTVGLTGCFGNPVESLVEGVAQNQAEEVIEGIAENAGVDLETGGELPEDFPAEVPIIDAPIALSTVQESDAIRMWTVTMTPDDAPAAMQEARTLLLDAGFAEDMWGETGTIQGQFSIDGVSVGLMQIEETIAYSVIRQL